MSKTYTQSVLLFAAFFNAVLAQPPSIESDGDDLVLRASAGDVKFVTQSGGTASLAEMMETIQQLQQQVAEATDNSTANVDTAMVEVSTGPTRLSAPFRLYCLPFTTDSFYSSSFSFFFLLPSSILVPNLWYV